MRIESTRGDRGQRSVSGLREGDMAASAVWRVVRRVAVTGGNGVPEGPPCAGDSAITSQCIVHRGQIQRGGLTKVPWLAQSQLW